MAERYPPVSGRDRSRGPRHRSNAWWCGRPKVCATRTATDPAEGPVRGVASVSRKGKRAGRQEQPGRNRLAGLTGALAAGLAVLAVLVLGAQLFGWVRGHAGPGLGMLGGNLGAAVAAIAAQLVVDRERGIRAVVCQITIVLLTIAVLSLLWWW